MPADRDQLRAFYASDRERERLAGDEGWLEWRRTCALIAQHIPAGGRVLDLGCGPGRYAGWLAGRGDRVTLVDLSAEQLTQAHQHLSEAGLMGQIDGLLVGDAADLSGLPGPLFDAVLALGPLYHAADMDEVAGFISQIAAVTRPGGVLLAAFIPRISGLTGLIAGGASGLLPGALSTLLETGQHRGTFFPDPEQITAALSADFIVEKVCSLRGLGSGCGAQLRALAAQPDAAGLFAEIMALIDATATRPDIISQGWHAVAVAARR